VSDAAVSVSVSDRWSAVNANTLASRVRVSIITCLCVLMCVEQGNRRGAGQSRSSGTNATGGKVRTEVFEFKITFADWWCPSGKIYAEKCEVVKTRENDQEKRREEGGEWLR
jgi:hypothetical protein